MSFQKTIFDTIGIFLVEKVEFILKQSISTNLILQGLYSCIIMSVVKSIHGAQSKSNDVIWHVSKSMIHSLFILRTT